MRQQLRRRERLEQLPYQGGVAGQGGRVGVQQVSGEAGVHDVDLGRACQPVETLAVPGRDARDDRQVLQQPQVRVGGDAGGAGVSGGRLLVQFLAGAGRARLQHGADFGRPGIALRDLGGVEFDELLHVGVEPAGAAAARQAKHVGEPSGHYPLQVLAPGQVAGAAHGRVGREQGVDGVVDVVVLDLSLGQSRHPDPYQPARAGPGRRSLRGPCRAGEDEAAPGLGRVRVHRPLDRADDLGRLLPLVDHHRARRGCEHSVGVLPHRLGRSGHGQVDHGVGEPASRGRLAASARPHDQQRGEGREELRLDQALDDPRIALRHRAYRTSKAAAYTIREP